MENIECKNCHRTILKRKGAEFCSTNCRNEYWNAKKSNKTNTNDEKTLINGFLNASLTSENEKVPPEKILKTVKVISFDYALLESKLKGLRIKRTELDIAIKRRIEHINGLNEDSSLDSVICGIIAGSSKGFLGAGVGAIGGVLLNKYLKNDSSEILRNLNLEINDFKNLLSETNIKIFEFENKLLKTTKYQDINIQVDNPEYSDYLILKEEKEKELKKEENWRKELEEKKNIEEKERQNQIDEIENGVIASDSLPLIQSRIISSKELSSIKYNTLDFQGKWKEFIGEPASNFYMLIYGRSGSGKSTFSVQLALYLALKFGKVLYVSGEEGFSKTLQHKLLTYKAVDKNLDFADLHSLEEIIEFVPHCIYDFIIIDSLNNMKIDAAGLRHLKELYEGVAIIVIAQSTKDGKMRGSNEIVHDCSIEILVENGIASTIKNRFKEAGSSFKVFT